MVLRTAFLYSGQIVYSLALGFLSSWSMFPYKGKKFKINWFPTLVFILSILVILGPFLAHFVQNGQLSPFLIPLLTTSIAFVGGILITFRCFGEGYERTHENEPEAIDIFLGIAYFMTFLFAVERQWNMYDEFKRNIKNGGMLEISGHF